MERKKNQVVLDCKVTATERTMLPKLQRHAIALLCSSNGDLKNRKDFSCRIVMNFSSGGVNVFYSSSCFSFFSSSSVCWSFYSLFENSLCDNCRN